MNRLFAILLVLCGLLSGGIVFSQESTAEPEPVMPPVLERIAPQSLPYGQPASITLLGSGFTDETIVTVESVGTVDRTVISETQITASVPGTLNSGLYDVSINNTAGSSQLADALTVQSQPTPVQVSISRAEPASVVQGESGVLSVMGANFTASTVIRLVGAGLLPTTYLHSGALTATLPESLMPGDYGIEVSDPLHGTASAPGSLQVRPVPGVIATLPPPPTPNPVMREPALILSRVGAAPDNARPGQPVRISFTVTNRGNQTARLIDIAPGQTTEFTLAAGQASVNIPDLTPGASQIAQMNLTVSRDVSAGVRSVPLVLTYRDPDGKAYTTNASAGVTVGEFVSLAQPVIDAYTLEPEQFTAGDTVTLRLTIANPGTMTASQVMLRIGGENSVLLPQGSSDSFFVGDVAPQQRVPLELALRVSSKAAAGVQSQPMTLHYVQEGKPGEMQTAITLDVAPGSKPQPQMLLSRYTIDPENLQPGTRFTLTVHLDNVGIADAVDTVVTFGTVQTTPDTASPPTSPDGGSGSGANTTPSTTFAPQGSAGIAYIGTIAANQGNTTPVEQAFIVSGTTNSGIYNLPVTLRYTLPDNTIRQDNLSISLVVVAPPRLLINPPNPLPEMLNAGEPMPVSLTLQNAGTRNINLTEARFEVTNGEVVEGREIVLQTLKAGEDTSLTGVVLSQDEGEQVVTITIAYLDELNQPQSITQTYTAQVMIPEPPPIEEPPMEPPPVDTVRQSSDWFGRLMMALLGLGS